MEFLSFEMQAALVGLGGGMVLGLAARLGQFCTLGALETAVYGGDQRRLRMWGIVLAVAISTSFMLQSAGLFKMQDTIYHALKWNPLASIFGGLVFGYGMAYAGNCGFGALTRFGGGDLRSMVVVIVLAIFGFVTLSGPLAALRVMIFPPLESTGPQGFAHLFSGLTGFPPIIFALFISAGFLFWALAYAPLRANKTMIFWAVAVGLAIASAWLGTAYLAREGFGEVSVQGHTFTVPPGRTLLYLMTSSGGGMNFAVGSVSGVLAGAFLGSSIKGSLRWEACEDPRELGRQVFGAALMGIGGVVATGCSIGQGLSAFSTLAYSAPMTLGSIVLGALLGLRHILHGFAPD